MTKTAEVLETAPAEVAATPAPTEILVADTPPVVELAVTKQAVKKAAVKKAVTKKTQAKPVEPNKSVVDAAPATEPATVASKKKATAPAKPAKEKKAAPKKPKLIRDSFTFPEDDYALIGSLKQRALDAGHEIKKSELLRAGLAALGAMSEPQLLAALAAVERIKTGRPAK